MSIERQVQIYTYTLNVLNVTLKIKFPCKIYLEFNGESITTEVAASSPNKFVFNQEVTLKNETEKEYIEVIVQLVTDKGAKYVGGVLKFSEKELIGSEGERLVVPIAKCLDSDATCDVRVDQVSTSRIMKKEASRRKGNQRTEFHPDLPQPGWSGKKAKINQGAETKSEYNMPLSMSYKRDKYDIKVREPTVGGAFFSKKKGFDVSFEREPAVSAIGGMSAVQFEVYKEGYNKLKDKYRKEAENARTEANKRMALESNENNLKLEIMRYKLKNDESEKTLLDKNQKIKQFTQSVSGYQKKELDIKYMKEEIENKDYIVRNLEETIKTLTRDNNDLKNLQSNRQQSQQETIRNLKDDLEHIKKELENRETELTREVRSKNDIISKKQYDLHLKNEEIERVKYVIEDLEKAMSNKMFEWEKIQQADKSISKTKQEELKEKIVKLQEEKGSGNQKGRDLEEKLEEKRSEIVRIEYDKKVLSQNYDSLFKEVEQLKTTREKYLELVREHKLLGDEKIHIEKAKERQHRMKQSQVEELNQKYSHLSEHSKKTIKQLEEKYKTCQLKIIELEGQNQLLRNQQQKSKRHNEMLSKEVAELKTQLKEAKADGKDKEERLLGLTNQFSDSKNVYKQGDYASRLELDRQKNEIEKLSRLFEEEQNKANDLTDTVNKLELEISKTKMQFQFKEEKFGKEQGYAKDKHKNIESVKTDLETQLSTATASILNLKTNEKTLNEKVQKLELDGIKNRETIETFKKDIKVYEEKLQNSENNIKAKAKELADQLENKQTLEKDVSAKDGQLVQLKNDLNKESNEKLRNQKIVQILQADLAKAKEEQTRLNSVIKAREKTEEELRDEMKKQKEEFTKLDMKLSALKKEYEKFKDSLVDNLYITFSSIPDGLSSSPSRQSKIASDRNTVKENAQILNLLTSFGKDARSNINKVLDALKITQKERETINSEYSTSMNKSNTNEFEFNQNINKLEEEISQLLEDKQNAENKYEEEIFLLEGRVREKEAVINELTQQIEELDFLSKNIRNQLEVVREETSKKDSNKTKLINELREQIEYQISSISVLENSEEKLYEEINMTTIQLEETSERLHKTEKELVDTKDSLSISEEDCFSYKRQLKKANQRGDELSLEYITEKEESEKLKTSIDDEERKSSELRQFVNGLMKQKEEIIKKELEKSEQLLENETKIEELKHENQWLGDELKKYKKIDEQLKDSLKKTTKTLKEEENTKNDEKNKNLKLTERLKEREKQIVIKDESLSRLEEKLRRQKDKSSKDTRQLEAELDETYLKLLNKEKDSNEKIISLESENERYKHEVEKLKEEVIEEQETIFNEKNKNENISTNLRSNQRDLTEALEQIKHLDEKVNELEEELHNKEEEKYKIQGKVFALDSKLEQKELEKNEKMENLHEDWLCKYEGMMEEFEQRMELVEKEKQFLKDRVDEKERQNKKVASEVKMQENNVTTLKKGFEEKIRNFEEDRLTVLSQKNTENQRLIEENRVNFENLKFKESDYRKLNSEFELSKSTSTKLENRLKETEEKIRSLNRTYQTEVEELKRKEQTFKKLKENVISSVWKSEREVRKVVQSTIKKILEVVDEESTMKVVQVTKTMEHNVAAAISIKIEEEKP